MKKTIDNIVPYKPIRLDCFRQALIPIIIHYNKIYQPLLLMNYVYLKYSDKLIFEDHWVRNNCDSYKDIGIFVCNDTVTVDDYINKICTYIDNDIPVISLMDLFYNKLYPSVYLSLHSKHGVPVYGYDKENKLFDILDADYVEDFRKKKCKIEFQTMIDCFIGWSHNYNRDNKYIISITPITGLSWIDNIEKSVQLYRSLLDEPEVIESSKDLEIFYEWFLHEHNNEAVIMQAIGNICNCFNKVINGRLLEHDGYLEIFDSSKIAPIVSYLEELINEYNFFRAILYKTFYSKKYNGEYFERGVNSLNKILKLEKEHLDYIGKYLTLDNIHRENFICL